jgi:hypothetical protein
MGRIKVAQAEIGDHTGYKIARFTQFEDCRIVPKPHKRGLQTAVSVVPFDYA